MTGSFLTFECAVHRRTDFCIVATMPLHKLIADKYVSKSDGIEPSAPIMTGTVLLPHFIHLNLEITIL